MATINALMKHLRANGVQITGTNQKQKLRKIGYYHGYKGYRFARTSTNKLPISNFNEIAALHDFDMQLKALLYPYLMQAETALKNRVLEATLADAHSEKFDDIYKYSLTSYRCAISKSKKKDEWTRRLRLRTEIDNIFVRNHEKNQVVRHFRDLDQDVPIWALFELMTLGSFGSFYTCLDDRVKLAICRDLNMPIDIFDSKILLEKIIFIFRDLRNAIAHNGIILDVRFQTGKIDGTLKNFMCKTFSTKEINFDEITDYVLLLIYLLAHLGFTKTECRQLLQGYKTIIERYRDILPYNIYSQFLRTQTRAKVTAGELYIRNL